MDTNVVSEPEERLTIMADRVKDSRQRGYSQPNRSIGDNRQDIQAGVLVLDGPSALALYRDRDDVAASRMGEADAQRPHEPTGEDAENFYLSDEDIAAILTGESVFGKLAMTEEEELLAPSLDLPRLERSAMVRMRGALTQARDIKRVPYGELGIRPPAEDSTLYLLVPQQQNRRIVKHVRQRLCTSELPLHSFLRMRPWAYVPTPEFTFLLMARYLDIQGLITLGMELCGHYRLVGAPTQSPIASSRTLYDQKPLTSPHRIQAFLERVAGFRGLSLAKRACGYLAAGSASPMETALYLLLCLPRSLGGYGLPHPLLNAKRRVTTLAGAFTMSKALVPDLLWPESLLDIEYDSEEFHASAECLERGARRTLALQSMNVEVVSVTKEVVYDEVKFEALARLIARTIGTRIWKPTAKTENQRSVLRATVLGGYAAE